MKLLLNSAPRPHLLSDIAEDSVVAPELVGPCSSEFVLGKSTLFSGNGRAIFVGIALGGLLLCGAGHFFNEHQRAIGAEPISLKRFVRTHTHVVSASDHASVPPAPIVVEVDSKLVHVSAIALGHPRMAVINGQSVAEGDYVKIRSANPAVTISLRVHKIVDRRIELTDGKQNLTAHLAIPGLSERK